MLSKVLLPPWEQISAPPAHDLDCNWASTSVLSYLLLLSNPLWAFQFLLGHHAPQPFHTRQVSLWSQHYASFSSSNKINEQCCQVQHCVPLIHFGQALMVRSAAFPPVNRSPQGCCTSSGRPNMCCSGMGKLGEPALVLDAFKSATSASRAAICSSCSQNSRSQHEPLNWS